MFTQEERKIYIWQMARFKSINKTKKMIESGRIIIPNKFCKLCHRIKNLTIHQTYYPTATYDIIQMIKDGNIHYRCEMCTEDINPLINTEIHQEVKKNFEYIKHGEFDMITLPMSLLRMADSEKLTQARIYDIKRHYIRTPEQREKMNKYQREYTKKPGVKEKRNRYYMEYRKRPEYIALMKERGNSEEYKMKCRLASKKYYDKNKDTILPMIKERAKKYYKEHKKEIRERCKINYNKNKERESIRMKKYYEKNKVEIQERKRKEYLENKEREKKRLKKYYDKNKDKILTRKKQVYAEKKK